MHEPTAEVLGVERAPPRRSLSLRAACVCVRLRHQKLIKTSRHRFRGVASSSIPPLRAEAMGSVGGASSLVWEDKSTAKKPK